MPRLHRIHGKVRAARYRRRHGRVADFIRDSTDWGNGCIKGWTRWPRRIPNWLTVPGFAVGVLLSTYSGGWSGLKSSLLGTGLAFVLLLPFWLLRSLGAGDLKFAAALGAYTGPGRLIDILIGSVFVAGVMAWALTIYKAVLYKVQATPGSLAISYENKQTSPRYRITCPFCHQKTLCVDNRQESHNCRNCGMSWHYD